MWTESVKYVAAMRKEREFGLHLLEARRANRTRTICSEELCVRLTNCDNFLFTLRFAQQTNYLCVSGVVITTNKGKLFTNLSQ